MLRFSVLLESAGSNKARTSVLGGERCWQLSIIASLRVKFPTGWKKDTQGEPNFILHRGSCCPPGCAASVRTLQGGALHKSGCGNGGGGGGGEGGDGC